MQKLNDIISYLPAVAEPLSSDAFLILYGGKKYLYDVGANPEFLEELAFESGLTIVLSHFHEDHVKNLPEVPYERLLVSNFTEKHVHQGEIVREDMEIAPGVEAFLLPACHAKGCLCLNIDHKYCFVGDAMYPEWDKEYTYSLLNEMYLKLKATDTEYFVVSHRPNPIMSKATMLVFLEFKLKSMKAE